MADKRNIGLLAAFISSLIWGYSVISMKVLVGYMSPVVITFFRYISASVFLGILLKTMGVKKKLKRKHLYKVAISGILGITLSMYFTTVALKSISASMAGLINGAIPILTLVSEILFFGKRVTKKIMFAFLLSTFGIYLTVIESGVLIKGTTVWVGLIYMICGIICWIVYTFATQPLAREYSSISVLTYQTLFATASLIPFAAVEIYNMDNFLKIISLKSVIGNLLFLGIFASAIAYYTYVIGINYLGSSTASIFMNFIPIVSMIGSYFMLNDIITYKKFIGLCMVITSIFLVNFDMPAKWIKSKEKIAFKH